MANEIGTAYVGVELDRKGIQKGLGGLTNEVTSQLGPLGGILEGALTTPWTAAAAAAVGGAVVIGKALYGIGKEFDDMSDTIATATGATGKELDGLVDSAKEVATTVPVSFADAGEAIAGMRARTGLTGKALEGLTEQVVAMAKITDTDLNTAIETSTRLLGDWGLKGADASEGLDTLMAASQETGVEVDRLAELMTKFGGPFRQMGVGFEESAALLGKWEKEGVNTELVAGSMRIALGKFAKAGREPAKAFQETIDTITKLGPGAEATGLAIKTFGARAGPDMAAAILEGRFAVEDLERAIKNSDTTILGAEKSTRDFSENWLLFKNQLKEAVGPAATALFGAIGQGMAKLNEELPPVIAALKQELGPAFRDIGVALKEIWPVLVELAPLLKVAFAGSILIVRNLAAAIRLLATVIAEVVKLVKAVLAGDWSAAWKAAQAIVKAFVDYAKSVFGNYLGYLKSVLSPFRSAATAIGNAIRDGVMGVLRGLGNLIAGAIRGAIGAVKSAADAVGTAVVSGVKAGLSGLLGVLSTMKSNLISNVRGVVGTVYGAASAIGRAIVDGILSGVGGLYGALKSKLEGTLKSVLTSLSPFSPVEKGGEEYIGKAIMEGAIRGVVVGTPELSSALAESVKKAVEAGRAQIEAARGTFSASWSQLSSDLLAAFDATTGAALTKHEQMLKKAEEQRANAERQSRLAEAQAGLAAAQAEGDPEAVKAAQKAVDDALFEIQRADWERQAAEERKQRDAKVALRRRHFEEDLQALQNRLQREGATEGEARKAITKLMRSYGVDYKSAGDALGKAFSTGLSESMQQTVNDVEAILKRIRDAIADVRQAAAAVQPPKKKAGAVAAVPGVGPAATGGLMLAAPMAAGGGSGLAGPVPLGARLRRAVAGVAPDEVADSGDVEVRVFIGETELRGIVRTEVVRSDTGLARTLLAGVRA